MLLLSGCGVTAPADNAGYVDFETPKYEGLARDTSVSLGPRVLRFAARHSDDNPQAQAVLKRIDGIRVKVFSLNGDADIDAISADLAERASALFDESWKPFLRVRNDGETVMMYLKQQDEAILGLAGVVVDEQELVFLNVMGDLRAEQLSELVHHVPYTDALAFTQNNSDE